MIAVAQRVAHASVTARTGEDAVHEASISRGWLALVAVERGDGPAEMEWMADKLAHLRIFPDAEGKMNLSVLDVGGEAMVISQFTLAGEMRKGTRPSFTRAEAPEAAAALLEALIGRLRERHGLMVATGVFGASMQVSLVNDGPVTILLDRRAADAAQ